MRAFTLLGIIIALVAVALIIAIILPIFQKPHITYKYERCRDHLKGIAIGLILYSEQTGSLPAAEKWNDLASEYIEQSWYQCSSIEQAPKTCPYALNKNISNLKYPLPHDIVMLFESPVGWNQAGGPEMMVFRHKDHKNDAVCNVVLCSGETKTVNEKQAANLKWKPAP